LEDIFSVQDEITRRIVTSIAPRIEAEGLDLAKRRPPEDMRAYDYYLRAKSQVDTPRGIADLKQGREYCERAIEIDASFARAHAYRALSYIVGITLIESDNLDDWRRQAMESAETAVALDPMDGVCHWALREAALHAKQPGRARDHIARALALNPNDADVLAVSGLIEAATGDPEAGLRQLNQATERNPSSPPLYHWWRGVILCLSGEFDEALHAVDRFGTPNPGVLRWRAATLVQLGRIDEARADVRALLAIRPGATISEVKRSLNYVSKLDYYFDNLRQADLPE
jgi:tetratricopeptide (TPR) repeat protein